MKPCCSKDSARSPMPGRNTKRHMAGPAGFGYSMDRRGVGAAMGPTQAASSALSARTQPHLMIIDSTTLDVDRGIDLLDLGQQLIHARELPRVEDLPVQMRELVPGHADVHADRLGFDRSD